MPEKSQGQLKLCEEPWYEYEPYLRKYCTNKLSGSVQEVDDVISQAFLILCKAVHKNSQISNPKAWLFGTVNNIIKDKYTEINELKNSEVSLESYELPYEFDYIDKLIKDKDINAILDEIMDTLSEDEKKLISLFYEMGLSYKEIAQIYDSNEFAVKQRSYRLKKKIKKMARAKLEKLF